MTNVDCLIVGGGIAGLTAAAYLTRAGREVLLLERNEKVGGLISGFWQEGFYFDAGVRAFEDSGILLPMLRQLGLDLDLIRSPIRIGLKDRSIAFTPEQGLDDYREMLQHFFPDERADIDRIISEIRRIVGYMDVIYGIENPLFADRLEDKRYLLTELLPWYLRYQRKIGKASRLNLPVNEYLSRFTANRALIDMITQHFFDQTPTFFALSYFSLYLDYLYPRRGTARLPEQLCQLMRQQGGEIRYRTEIRHVDPLAKIAVSAEGETFHYRHLIWAADATALYKAVPEGSVEFRAKKQKILNHPDGDSVLTLYSACKLPPKYFAEKIGPHGFYTPELRGLSALEDTADLKAYFDLTTYEISIPALREPTLAPEGQTGLIISTRFPYAVAKSYADEGRYTELKKMAEALIPEILDRTIFPGYKESLLFQTCSTPLTLERINGSKAGALTGWAFTTDGIPSENRLKKIPESIHTPIPDVYQVGQWSFSPAGVPTCILTGRFAADHIIKLDRGKGSSV